MAYYDPRELFATVPDSNDGNRPPFKTSLRESIDMLLSNSWPYKSISPFQAYLLGVFGCLSIFVTYVLVSNWIYATSRRRRRRFRPDAKRKNVSKQKRKKSCPLSDEKDIRTEECHPSKMMNLRGMEKIGYATSNDSIDSYEIPKHVPNRAAFTQLRRQLHRTDSNRQKINTNLILTVNAPSCKLYEHMNSFPLEMHRNERATEEDKDTTPSGGMCLLDSEFEVQKEENPTTESDSSARIDFQPHYAKAHDEEHKLAAKPDGVTSDNSSPEVDEDKSDASRDERNSNFILNANAASCKLSEYMSSFPFEMHRHEGATEEDKDTTPSGGTCLLDSEFEVQKEENATTECDTSEMIDFQPHEPKAHDEEHKLTAKPDDVTSDNSSPEVDESMSDAALDAQHLKNAPISSALVSLTHSTRPNETLRTSPDSNREIDSAATPPVASCTKDDVKIAFCSKNTSVSQSEEQHVTASNTSCTNLLSCHKSSASNEPPEILYESNVAKIATTENVSSTSSLIVLLSKGVADYAQAANQKATLSLLNDLDLSYKVIDGMDPSQREKRNEMFKVSGVRGNYPQIFINENSNHCYLGGYEWLERQSTDELNKMFARNQRKTLNTASQEKMECSSSESGSSFVHPMKEHLTLLISNGVADYIQAAKQKSALLLLTDFSIPYKIVDGMDPLQREKRNELFKISGIRGNYPQLFAFDESSGEHRYLGNSDWLEAQSTSNIKAILGETAVAIQ
ncbi:hypothetical protein HJC23_007996 [Cyclotella cryptica]|uniref:Uncharacterized protein n=1 Tax=Cyclotella cryptica TaxID=29204 RepID=A0ABD3P931_9STRA|eukprot:CCRYP_016964-RA/>CCRYP_016964-RA protein AED:0.06 eAED:0.06 QI:0/-1/0/1/-1/1/1/0/737